MKTIKRIFAIIVLIFTITSAHSQYLHLYKNNSRIKSYVTESIDSMLFDTSSSTYYMDLYNNGTKHRVDNLGRIDNFKLGGEPIKSGVYLGIVAFSDGLEIKQIGDLNSSTKSTYQNFVSSQTMKGSTHLYYAVENAIGMLKEAKLPEDLTSVSLVTFTDGLDDGSLFMTNNGYTTDDEYLQALNSQIKSTKVSNLNINAYTIGFNGGYVVDLSQFNKNLKLLASKDENAKTVKNISDVENCLKEISDQINKENHYNNVSVIINGKSNGTILRITLDNVSNASSSQMYIEGKFNFADQSLIDVKYVGVTCENGSIVGYDSRISNSKFKYLFEDVKTNDGSTINPKNIKFWTYIPSSGLWQATNEGGTDSEPEVETLRKSAVVVFALDCSSSLSSDFNKIKSYANSFINTLASYGNNDEFSPIDLRGNTPPETPETPERPDEPTDTITDNHTYFQDIPTGLTCKNKWIIDRQHTKDQFLGLQFVKDYATRARTAAIDTERGKIYIGYSSTVTIGEGDAATSTDYAHLVIFDLETGAYEGELPLTYNGAPIDGLLCANQVGVDDAGNVWICGMYSDVNAKPAQIYVVENFETGACKLVGEWKLPDEETDAAGRIDYWDVVGDITGETANAVCMGAVGTTAAGEKLCLYRWELAQGATEWVANEDDFAGYVSNTDLAETYPADQTTWGGAASTVRIVAEEGNLGSLFYVDSFTTCPSLYNTNFEMLNSFADAPDLAPAVGCNGIDEFYIGENLYIVYAEAQYNVSPGCRVNICELGKGSTFGGMRKLWSVPEAGLGEVSDGGTRIHNIDTYKVVDKNGKEGVYLLTYKCNNGLGLYLIAEEGFDEATAR